MPKNPLYSFINNKLELALPPHLLQEAAQIQQAGFTLCGQAQKQKLYALAGTYESIYGFVCSNALPNRDSSLISTVVCVGSKLVH